MEILIVVIALLLLWNCLALFIMGWDKAQAKRQGSRVSEKTLFFFAFCLAGPGIWLGMNAFRHKTKRVTFQVGVPVGIMVDCVLIWLALRLF